MIGSPNPFPPRALEVRPGKGGGTRALSDGETSARNQLACGGTGGGPDRSACAGGVPTRIPNRADPEVLNRKREAVPSSFSCSPANRNQGILLS